MRQEAIVVRECAPGEVLIRVERIEACAHNCQECGGCPATVVLSKATDTTGAKPGDRVLVELPGAAFLPRLAFVLFFPVLLGLGGYFLGKVFFPRGRTLIAIGMVLVGILCVWLRERSGPPLDVRVVRKL